MITEKTNLYEYPIILLKFIDYEDKNQPLNVEIANKIYNSLTEEEKELNKHLEIKLIKGAYNIINVKTNEVLGEYKFR